MNEIVWVPDLQHRPEDPRPEIPVHLKLGPEGLRLQLVDEAGEPNGHVELVNLGGHLSVRWVTARQFRHGHPLVPGYSGSATLTMCHDMRALRKDVPLAVALFFRDNPEDEILEGGVRAWWPIDQEGHTCGSRPTRQEALEYVVGEWARCQTRKIAALVGRDGDRIVWEEYHGPGSADA